MLSSGNGKLLSLARNLFPKAEETTAVQRRFDYEPQDKYSDAAEVAGRSH